MVRRKPRAKEVTGPGVGFKVVITGGASGIGKALAEVFYAHGHTVMVIDKDEEALRGFPRRLGIDALQADLTLSHGRQKVIDYIKDHGQTIQVWINNAGIGIRGTLWELDAGRLEEIIQVNCLAPVLLSQAILKKFLFNKSGVLVNIGSSSSIQPLPFMSVYSASKAFVTNFTLGLSGEVDAKTGVHILTVCPSGTATSFQKKSGVNDSDHGKLLSPYLVAGAIYSALKKKFPYLIIGKSAQLMSLAAKIIPMSLQIRLWKNLMSKYR